FTVAEKLRRAFINVNIDYALSLKKCMQKADKIGASKCIIIGNEEITHSKCKIKDMKTGHETEVGLDCIEKLFVTKE
ncbi:MAG: histidine--tRNA ligase, partial [Proteobacteria bacterium]|nr:histidine--tRNA ligase [Pseudomonadota bacterium]